MTTAPIAGSTGVPIEHFAMIQHAQEQHRHECEVRKVAAMRNQGQRFQYLYGAKGVAFYRGEPAAAAIDRDVRALLGDGQPGSQR